MFAGARPRLKLRCFLRYLGAAGAEETLAEADQLRGDRDGEIPVRSGLPKRRRGPAPVVHAGLFIALNKKAGAFGVDSTEPSDEPLRRGLLIRE